MKNRVKELRIAAGMTQQQLAERVHAGKSGTGGPEL